MPTYTNLCILQGWLEVESVSTISFNRTLVPVLNGWIATTDHEGTEDVLDERHPVMVSGKAAEAVMEMSRKIQEKFTRYNHLGLFSFPDAGETGANLLVNCGRPFVIAQGKLVSHNGQSRLDVKHISLLGAPWGSLETLEELDLDPPDEYQQVMDCLSPVEKTALRSAVLKAMYSLAQTRGQEGDLLGSHRKSLV